MSGDKLSPEEVREFRRKFNILMRRNMKAVPNETVTADIATEMVEEEIPETFKEALRGLGFEC